jgi:S1-C subfamily serine protease
MIQGFLLPPIRRSDEDTGIFIVWPNDAGGFDPIGLEMQACYPIVMQKPARTLLRALIAIFVVVGSAIAGPFEDGVAAYTRRDYATALRLLRPLADQGQADAQVGLGFMYVNGQGVPRNYAEALKWFSKAADQGDAKAHLNLGFMYYKGQGVQNYVQAHMWLNLAASNPASDKGTREKAVRNRNIVASRMTPTQLEQAQTMAEQCLRSNYKDCGTLQNARGEDKVATRPTSTGTGFFVSENGHLVTSAHVVNGCQTVRSSHGGALRMIFTDEESDLALFVASEKPEAIARLRGGREARAGESVVAVGFPFNGLLSSDPIVTTGIISALSGVKNDRRRIQISAPVQPGNSGGPLLGENGSVVGVVVAKLNAMKVAETIGDIPQNVNFAVNFFHAPSVPGREWRSLCVGRQ